MTTEAAFIAAVPDHARRRFAIYADLLRHWQKTINLVAPSTLGDLWIRHFEDCLQVQAAVPDARHWVDLGSGGGFPGLVTAIVLGETPGAAVHLVESDKRKAAFLRTVSRETGVPAIVHAARIEDFLRTHDSSVDAVSARALAPLSELLTLAAPLLDRGAIGVFPKGQTGAAELTRSNLGNKYAITSTPSRTDRRSHLLIVRASRPSSA